MERSLINKIKYHTRNFVLRLLSLPTTTLAIIRFKISFLKHRDDPDIGIGLVVDELNSGGLESIVMNLYKGYRKKGLASYVIIAGSNISQYIDGLEDDPRQFQILHANKAKLLNYCRIHKIYTLHYHFSTFAMRTVHFLGIKTLYTIHNTYVWFTPHMWRHLKRSLKVCDFLIAVSDFAREFFIKKTGIKKVLTISNGIDIEQVKNNLKSASAANQNRKFYDLKPTDHVVAMVSSFSEQKYHLSLIGAIEELFKEKKCDPKNTKILMCGPILDKKIYRKITKTVKNSPYSKNFIIGKPINPTEIGAFLKNVPDLVVAPSLYEGGVPPLLIIEALICNTPVIMTDLDISNGPFANYIQTVPVACSDLSSLNIKSIRKIVYSKKSPNLKELSEKINKVIHNPKQYAPNIPASLLALLDTETMVKEYLKLIK